MTDSTMRLWKAFEKTDPGHTKKVTFGRSFTSIDAHWQVMRVTEILGPVGQGWGYDVQHHIHDFVGSCVAAIADVQIWWVDDSSKVKHYYGPIRGVCAYVEYDSNGKVKLTAKGKPDFDDDAAKKATTDALTKGLSHLGVSADVFLGLFDDNKYVAGVTRTFAAEKAAKAELPLAVAVALEQLVTAGTLEDLEKALANSEKIRPQWTIEHRDLYLIRSRQRRAQLEAPMGVSG